MKDSANEVIASVVPLLCRGLRAWAWRQEIAAARAARAQLAEVSYGKFDGVTSVLWQARIEELRDAK